jgi:hypothetical protein
MSYENGRDIPFDIDILLHLLPSEQPENSWQAIMEAPPGCEPETSKTEIAELLDIVRDCVELMLPQDQYIVQGIAYERITFEELGCRLGTSAPHAWRLKQIAYRRLGEILMIDGRIKKFLHE